VNTYQAATTLRVNEESSFEDVKYAYRKLALEFHPDKNSKEIEGEQFKKITEAYHFLKNENKQRNSKSRKTKTHEYTEPKTNSSHDFGQKKSRWDKPPNGKPPEEDWGRFTKEFEDANPNFWKEYEKKFWEEYDGNIHSKSSNTDSGNVKQPKGEPNLFVEVDPSLCIACCSCETIAPEVFHVDKLKQLNPKSKVYNEKGAGVNKIMSAAETCPTKAISVENKDTKEKLFPW